MKTQQKTKQQTSADLQETERDKKLLEPDEATLDLPDVKDIPGQEHVRPLPPGEMADTTISSADEEANDLLDVDSDNLTDHETNVTSSERDMLQKSTESMSTGDDEQLISARLDNKDDDGELLNEKINNSGSDLDIPGSEEDDSNEKIGEEDEENNSYSFPDQEDE